MKNDFIPTFKADVPKGSDLEMLVHSVLLGHGATKLELNMENGTKMCLYAFDRVSDPGVHPYTSLEIN